MKGEMSLHYTVKGESAWPKQFCSIHGSPILHNGQPVGPIKS